MKTFATNLDVVCRADFSLPRGLEIKKQGISRPGLEKDKDKGKTRS